jgi:multidrug resistance efflux pump
MKQKRAVIIAVVLVILAAGGAVLWTNPTQLAGLRASLGLSASQAVANGQTVEASGTIEAEEVSITTEIGGRVKEVRADEGDLVQAGDVLVRLDESEVLAKMGEVHAAVRAAQANLARVKAGARPEEIAAAKAGVAQAQAARDGAKRAWELAQEMLDNPLELDAQINEARSKVALAEQQVKQAQAAVKLAEVERDKYKNDLSDQGKTSYRAAEQRVRAAEAGLAAAQVARDGARRALSDLLAMRANPIALRTQVNQAKAQYETAQANVAAAQAALDALLAGPTDEEIAVAEAQVKQAEAALGLLEVQRKKLTLRAPRSGLITTRNVHVGETVQPGSSLMTVADLSEVRLKVFVPETQIGLVKLGQKVQVTVDSYPGQIFEGEVSYISPRAEFTPKNVQTKEERVNTVFAVKVSIPNPEMRLKPGMPADAVIGTSS